MSKMWAHVASSHCSHSWRTISTGIQKRRAILTKSPRNDMKRKSVYVRSYGPLSMASDVEIGWEDVWLRVASGRRTLRLAPCLVSRMNLLSDIEIAEKIA